MSNCQNQNGESQRVGALGCFPTQIRLFACHKSYLARKNISLEVKSSDNDFVAMFTCYYHLFIIVVTKDLILEILHPRKH